MERHIQKIVGDKLKELRTRAGLTHQELADALGWSRTAIYAAENGERAYTASDLTLLARAFRVLPGSLLLIPEDVDTVLVGTGDRAQRIERAEIESPSGTADPDGARARIVELAKLSEFLRDEAQPLTEELTAAFEALVALRNRIGGIADSSDDLHSLAMELRKQQLRYAQASSTQVVGAEKEESNE